MQYRCTFHPIRSAAPSAATLETAIAFTVILERPRHANRLIKDIDTAVVSLLSFQTAELWTPSKQYALLPQPATTAQERTPL